MSTEFRVLGPLEVRRDGELLALGGTRPRGVLAALLLERNSVVDARRLLYALYAEYPPETAVAQLHNAVKDLRTRLGAERGRIVTRAPGYVIRVDHGELDLDTFENDLRGGLAALRAGDPGRASGLLCGAEALWRGDALGDLAALPVRNFAIEVDARRAVAREARILAQLMLGKDLDLVPELQALTGRTERLDGCLMVALKRSGRRAEALEAFGAARRSARELGLDPSRQLSALHQAILVDDDGALDVWLRRCAQLDDAKRPRAQDDVTRRPSSPRARTGTHPSASAGSAVVLHVTSGPGAGRSYRYTAPHSCIVGRADDCDPQFGRDPLISRRHCRLDVDPPRIWIRDLGSSNGTYVNDERIAWPGGDRPGGARPGRPAVVELEDGDEIRLGGAVLQVAVDAPAAAVEPPSVPGYRRLRELSHRPTSVVHLVEREDTGELAVLKILHPDAATDRRTRQAFLREAEASRVLRHPNVVALRDSGVAGSALYLAYDYCDGGSLEDLLVHRLPVDEAVALTLQVLDGLAYAHEVPVPVRLAEGTSALARGLVHRDVKPSNILLVGSGSDRTAKLADFGLAKAFEQAGLSGHTRAGELGGTFHYMCRQQVLDYRAARPGVDVWAAAATLYRMLTGATPRDFPPGAEPVLAVLQSSAVPVRSREPSLPARLAAVIDAALVDDPDLAVTSAGEFRAALAGAL